ncbi:hypothetical protein IAU60_004772 [Kwoniella sp. DSM 27419]
MNVTTPVDNTSWGVDATADDFETYARMFVSLHHNLNIATFLVSGATDALLCGYMFIQAADYWTYSEDDKLFNKIIVAITTVTSAGTTMFIVGILFRLFVYNYGRYSGFVATQLLAYMCLFDIVVSTATQVFFTHRAFMLNNRSKLLIFAISALVLTSIVGAIGFIPVYGGLASTSDDNLWRISFFLFLWLATALGADVLITGSIMWSLFRSRTGWKQTDRTITKLLGIVIETQMPPTLVVLLFLVTFGATSQTMLLVIWPQWVQGKFYTCGLLASLNSRYQLRRAMQNDQMSGKSKAIAPVVHVFTETYVQRDDAPVPAAHVAVGNAGPRPYPASQTFTPKRKTLQDSLDMDDDSMRLDYQSDGSTHRLDYFDNESKRGLTEDSSDKGH